MQNAYESHLAYADIAIENMSSASSRIMDADIADSSSELIKKQILQQSASAMLSQANANPEIALSLLLKSIDTYKVLLSFNKIIETSSSCLKSI